MKINWLGHATFELTSDTGEVLVLDPWIEGNPAYPKEYEIRRVDAIAISHGHSDHTGGVVDLAKRFKPKVVAIFEIGAWLLEKGLENIIQINKGGTVDLGFVKLTMTHALHSSSIKDGGKVIYGGEAAGYILTLPDGRRGYFAGDTTLFGDMALLREMYQPELAFLPIGDHFTMGPHEAAHAARLIGAKRVIPMHYGTFPVLTGRPEDVRTRLEKDGIEVLTLEKGKPVQW